MALTEKLTAIGNAIRAKTGGTELLTLDAMPTEIEGIQTEPTIETLEVTSNGTYTAPDGVDGYSPVTVNVPQDGSPPDETFTISGNCIYRFPYNGWNWFLKLYSNRITFVNIMNATSMFEGNSLESIPFDINLSNSGCNCTSMFKNSGLKNIPYIKGTIKESTQYMFYGCYYLNEIPEDWCNYIDFSDIQEYQYAQMGWMFNSCYSLRNIPSSLISNLWSKSSSTSYVPYYYQYQSCYSLDELNDIGVQQATFTANRFQSTFTSCYRIKNITFDLQDDGTPFIANWKTQTIDLSNYVGYADFTSNILNYNSGITADKQVTDDTTYQALKDDPDWFTSDYNYSRYNHDSAVATINSLPDTSAYLASAGGTNTIKFKGAAGEKTDGGAINTLTEEEIAVATAKGWTVTFV